MGVTDRNKHGGSARTENGPAGNDHVDQIRKIIATLGTPTEAQIVLVFAVRAAGKRTPVNTTAAFWKSWGLGSGCYFYLLFRYLLAVGDSCNQIHRFGTAGTGDSLGFSRILPLQAETKWLPEGGTARSFLVKCPSAPKVKG